jgi:transposase-like protein
MAYTHLTDEMRHQAISLYSTGVGSVIIGLQLGISYKSVLRIIKSAGIAIRRPGGPGGARKRLADETVNQMVRLYGRGMTLEEIGRGTGRSFKVVHLALRKRGVKMRKPGRRRVESELYKDARRLYLRGGLTLREVGERFNVSAGTVWRAVHRCYEKSRGN